jgi:HK97 family phage major capsid protein
VSRLTVDNISLGFSKISSIVVLTEELIRLSTPAAEAVCRRDLIGALAAYMDQQFIDPTVAASTDVSPASISYGATSISSTGSNIAAVCTDVRAMFAAGFAGNVSYSTGVWVMHPRTATYLSMLRSTGDVFAFGTITPKGGTFFGLPVITSNAVPIDTGADTYIFLIDAQEVLLAQGAVDIDASNQASLQVSSAPSAGAQQEVSLWQNFMVGLKAEQFLNWKRAHDAGVIVLEDVSF